MKYLVVIIAFLFLHCGVEAQTVSITCESCLWLRPNDCDACSNVYKSRMFRGGLKIRKGFQTHYFEHPLSVDIVGARFRLTDANGQKFDFSLNETSFSSVGSLKSFIAACACSANSGTPGDTTSVDDTDRRLTSVAFINDSIRFQISDKSNTVVSTLWLDNAKPVSVKYITLTSLADSSLFKTTAMDYCPGSTVMTFDSCGVQYELKYNCSTSTLITLKSVKSDVVSSKVLYLDPIHGITAPLYKGSEICLFKKYSDAANSALYTNGDVIHFKPGAYNFGSSNPDCFTNSLVTEVKLHMELGAVISFGTQFSYGSPLVGLRNNSTPNSTKELFIDITGNGIMSNTGQNGSVLINQFNSAGKINVELDRFTQGGNGTFASLNNESSNLNIRTVEFSTNAGGNSFLNFLGQTNGYNTVNINSFRSFGSNQTVFSLVTAQPTSVSTLTGNSTSFRLDNAQIRRVYPGILSVSSVFEGSSNNRYSVTVNNFNHTLVNPYSYVYTFNGDNPSNQMHGLLAFTGNSSYVNSKNRVSFNMGLCNSEIPILMANKNNSEYVKFANSTVNVNVKDATVNSLPAIMLQGTSLDSTTIIINIDNLVSKCTVAMVEIRGCTLTNNSKIILRGKYVGVMPIYIIGNNISSDSKIILDGDFASESTAAVVVDENLGTSSRILFKGKYNGTTNSIGLFPGSSPCTVSVAPGTYSSKVTDVNITQQGTGIYVDSIFND